jgi:hypothetical protein
VLGLIPTVRPPIAIAQASFQWNYTTWLDFVAIPLKKVAVVIEDERLPN